MTSEYVPGHPHPALAGVVRSYAGYVERSPSAVRRRQAPTGTCTLILAWDGLLEMDGPGGPRRAQAFLAGMHDAPVVTAFTGHQQGVQVDLTPLGTLRLLGRPLDELTDRTPDLDSLGVPALARLPARLAADPTWPARFARVDAVLLGLLDGARAPDPEVAHAWDTLVRAGGRVPVDDLAARVGWSRRHLSTRFRGQAGLTPTAAGRVLRFRRAADLLVPGAGPVRRPSSQRLADLAADCGYADHSHLVREFRALAGCTPSAYAAGWADGGAQEFPDVQDDPAAPS